MNYTISPSTANVLDLIRDFEALIDRTAAAVDNYIGPNSSEDYCTHNIYPAAATFKRELESLLIQQIKDRLPIEGDSACI